MSQQRRLRAEPASLKKSKSRGSVLFEAEKGVAGNFIRDGFSDQ